MICDECGAELAPHESRCAECAAENAVYAAFRRSIAVPPLWNAVERRIRPRRWPMLAAAAMVVIAIGAALVVRTQRDDVVAQTSEHYARAFAKLESHPDVTMLAELDAAIDDASRAATRAPHDPVAATRLVAAYDAKVRLLREVRR